MSHVIENITPEQFKEITRIGENNTYPYLSRVKSQCAVERTLDNCVAKLRKILETESASAQIHSDVVSSRKNTIDRTPSFYTSRSINNLHELSYADPIRTAFSHIEADSKRDELLSPNDDLVHISHDAALNDEKPEVRKGIGFNEFGNSSDEFATLLSSQANCAISTSRSNNSFQNKPITHIDGNGQTVEMRRYDY